MQFNVYYMRHPYCFPAPLKGSGQGWGKISHPPILQGQIIYIPKIFTKTDQH